MLFLFHQYFYLISIILTKSFVKKICYDFHVELHCQNPYSSTTSEHNLSWVRLYIEVDIDSKIRAILGKTQFNASLLHWNRAETSSTCCRCGLKEDSNCASYLCLEALSLYTSIYQTLELTPNIIITDMLHGYQRHFCTGDQ